MLHFLFSSSLYKKRGCSYFHDLTTEDSIDPNRTNICAEVCFCLNCRSFCVGLKQILFKHIETAPRDILGGFPRLSREETLQMMDDTQKNLTDLYKEKDQTEDTKEDSSEDLSIPSLFDISVPVPNELKDEPAG